MCIPVRRFLGIGLGVFVLMGSTNTQAHAQFRPGLGGNPYVNPLAGQALFRGAGIGNAVSPLYGNSILQTQAMLHSPLVRGGGGLMYGGFGGNALGYGSLARGYGLGGYGLGGYGIAGGGLGFIGGTALSGAALGYGLSYGSGLGNTQWMMNPYQGYLQGAASITNANAQYQQTIQQARLVREEARRSALQTRRAMIEEAEWERAHMPDPEKIRQRELARELDHARVSPPPTDIWSARSLNALFGHLSARQGEGAKGPSVPLNEETLAHINLTTGDIRGSVGLLKDGVKLAWPETLLKEPFKENRQSLRSLLKTAYNSVVAGNTPRDATLKDLQANLMRMQEILAANVGNLSGDQYNEANRFLRTIGDTIVALKDPNVVNHFNGNWAPKSRDVAQLIQFMRDKGLQFAPAGPTDEAAYTALYNALATFDAGMPRGAGANASADANNKNPE